MLSYGQWLFVALTCSTEVSSVPEGLISWCKEFLNSACIVYIWFCTQFVAPNGLYFYFFFSIVSIYGSEHKNSFKYNVIRFVSQH